MISRRFGSNPKSQANRRRGGKGFGNRQGMNEDRRVNVRNAPKDMLPADASDETKNDCEIVVADPEARVYAELIEDNLKRNGLRVDLFFPTPYISVGTVVKDFASRGALYAILVNQTNALRSSATLYFLAGRKEDYITPSSEHINMPLDVALNLIIKDFEGNKTKSQEEDVTRTVTRRDSPVDDEAAFTRIFETLKDRKDVTLDEYDRVIKYLKIKRDFLAVRISEPTQYIDSESKNISESSLSKNNSSKLDEQEVVRENQSAPVCEAPSGRLVQEKSSSLSQHSSPPLQNIPSRDVLSLGSEPIAAEDAVMYARQLEQRLALPISAFMDDTDGKTPRLEQTRSPSNKNVKKRGYAMRNRNSAVQNQGSTVQKQGYNIQNQSSTVQKQSSTVQKQGPSMQKQGSNVQNQGSNVQKQNSDMQNQGSTVQKQGSNIQNQNSNIQNRRSTVQNQNSNMQNRDSTVQNQDFNLQNRGSNIQNRGSVQNKGPAHMQNRDSFMQNRGSSAHNQESTIRNQSSTIQNRGSAMRNQDSVRGSARNKGSNTKNRGFAKQNLGSSAMRNQGFNTQYRGSVWNQNSSIQNQGSSIRNQNSDIQNIDWDMQSQGYTMQNRGSGILNEGFGMGNLDFIIPSRGSLLRNESFDMDNLGFIRQDEDVVMGFPGSNIQNRGFARGHNQQINRNRRQSKYKRNKNR